MRGAAIYKIRARRLETAAKEGKPRLLYSRCAKYPVLCRPGTSDLSVFHQVFILRAYGCLDGARDVRLIIDCGANVGYSAIYFLNRFPEAHVVAIEPDDGNFRLLQQNLAPYGNRASAIHSGVWSHRCGLSMSKEKYRDGREWARQVRPCASDDQPEFLAVDVATLLTNSGHETISVLKVDIEGAEAEVFSAGDRRWIDVVDNIAIELHDATCESIFMKAIESRRFNISRCGEPTVCRRFDAR
jgi:FkbM family methyltransferase